MAGDQGKIIFSNGEYIGEFKNGKRDGKGKITLYDGEVYEGNWKDDMKHGAGVLTTADGKKYEGEWLEDKYIEDSKYYPVIVCFYVRNSGLLLE